MAKIILFGDSIFAGYKEGYMHPVITEGIAAAFPDDQIQNMSIPGHTTMEAVADLKRYVLPQQPTLIIIFFGSNDASDITRVRPALFEQNLKTMVQDCHPAKCILVSAPYGTSPDRPLKRLATYRDIAALVADETGAFFVDLFDKMSITSDPDELIQTDGIHFTDAGNQLLLSALIPTIKKTQKNDGGL